MRIATLASVLLLVCSCGGGGAAPVPGPGDTTGVQDQALERTREILESCTLADLDELLAILELFGGSGDTTGLQPDLQITGIDLLEATVSWTLDVDVDGVVDLSGTVRFEDSEGNPTIPFDLTDLLGGFDDILSLLGLIEDGTVVIVTFSSTTTPQVAGQIAVTVVDSMADSISGTATIDGTDCDVELELQDVAGTGDVGVFPSTSAFVTIVSSTGSLEGEIVFDGTSTVTLGMSIDGGTEVYSFTYDVATGVLTDNT